MEYDIRGRMAFEKFVEIAKQQGKQSILDIGCGKDQPHSTELRERGFDVYTNDFFAANRALNLYSRVCIDGTRQCRHPGVSGGDECTAG